MSQTLVSLLKPVVDQSDTKFVQLGLSSGGDYALFYHSGGSSSQSGAPSEQSFVLPLSGPSECIFASSGVVIHRSRDMSQLVEYSNGQLHLHSRSSSRSYEHLKSFRCTNYMPKFAVPITLAEGQKVLVVFGVLNKRLQEADVAKYFGVCSHSDPVKIAAAYTFFYVLDYETGEQINSFLVPIKRKHQIADVVYDGAGLLHLHYRNGQDVLLRLTVKPLAFYNLHFTVEAVLLLDSCGEQVKPSNPPDTPEVAQLEALSVSRINTSSLLFMRKTSASGITVHTLCNYSRAESICHIYREDAKTGTFHTFLMERNSSVSIATSLDVGRLYYIYTKEGRLFTAIFEELFKKVDSNTLSDAPMQWSEDDKKFFLGFCRDCTSTCVIDGSDFSAYGRRVQAFLQDRDSRTQQSQAQAQCQTVTDDRGAQDFSVPTNSVVSNISQISWEESDESILSKPNYTHNGNDLAARVSALEKLVHKQSMNHAEIIKEIDDMYGSIEQFADKQTKLARKLEEYKKDTIKTGYQEQNRSEASTDQSMTVVATAPTNQLQSLKDSITTLGTVLVQVLLGVITLVIDAATWAAAKLPKKKGNTK